MIYHRPPYTVVPLGSSSAGMLLYGLQAANGILVATSGGLHGSVGHDVMEKLAGVLTEASQCGWHTHGESAMGNGAALFTCGIPEAQHPITGLLAHSFVSREAVDAAHASS